MKILLEKEDVKWATTTDALLGNVRWLVVTVGVKQFYVRREIDPQHFYLDEERAKKEVDALLLREMERMMEKAITAAANLVPEGELL